MPSMTTHDPSLRARCAVLALVLPSDVAFSHVAAAALWGLPVPGHLLAGSRVDIIRPSGQPRIRRSDVITHRGSEQRGIVELDGLRLTSPVDTFIDLGAVSARGLSTEDLVAIGRHLLATPEERTLEALIAAGDRRPRVHGRPLVDAALARLAAPAQ